MSFPRLDIPVRSEKRQLSMKDTILCILYCPNDTICIFFSPWCMSEGHRPVCVQIIWQLRGPNQALSGIGHSRGLLQYPRRYFILWFYCVSVTKWCLVGYGTGALWDFFYIGLYHLNIDIVLRKSNPFPKWYFWMYIFDIWLYHISNQGPVLLTLKSFYLKAFSRKHGCDWLMLKHQPITATLSAKSF